MFTLTQLAGFVAVAEELHFGAAAERLHITQPPLSRQVRELERSLGAPLFERTSRSVAITPAGAALLPAARRILQLAERAADDVRRTAAGERGRIVLGATAMAAQSALPGILELAATALPDVRIEVRELVTELQLDALEEGTIDLAVVRRGAARAGTSTRRILREELQVAVRDDDELADRASVPPELLADRPLLGYAESGASTLRTAVDRLLDATGVHVEPAQTASQVATLLAFVAAGLGVAVVPESAARLTTRPVVLRPLELADGARELAMIDIEVAWRPEELSSASRRLLAEIVAHGVGHGASHGVSHGVSHGERHGEERDRWIAGTPGRASGAAAP
jgi:DNA-binding transcriptional LysR family regulator